MNAPVVSLLGYGFLLGWSVAWPPGPINAEIARRCLVRGFRSGLGVLLGACSGDALWALVVLLGIGVVFTGAGVRASLAVLSILLLLILAALYLRGTWRAWRGPTAEEPPPSRFDGHRAGYALGLTMALTSPWNVAFWLAVIGRPELIQYGTAALPLVVAGVLAGTLTWGLLWSGLVVRIRRVGTGRVWDVVVKGLTGLLMLYFAVTSLLRFLAI